MTPRGCVFACRRSSCTGRGNGGRAGWRVSCDASCSWTGSGPTACRRAERGRARTRFSRSSGGLSADRTGQWVEAASRLVRQRCHGRSLGRVFGLAEAHKLYACHDRLSEHKDALFAHLVGRWRDLFNARFDVLLYDLTSTSILRSTPHSCRKATSAGMVTAVIIPAGLSAGGDRLGEMAPEGLPLAYEVLPGNTADNQTLRQFLSLKIETQYGEARRVWVMDRGIPSEAVLAEMRQSDPPVRYLVGTPKGRLTQLEKHLLDQPWREGRKGSPGQTAGRGRRVLCLRPKRRPGPQGEGDAPAAAENGCGSASMTGSRQCRSRASNC